MSTADCLHQHLKAPSVALPLREITPPPPSRGAKCRLLVCLLGLKYPQASTEQGRVVFLCGFLFVPPTHICIRHTGQGWSAVREARTKQWKGLQWGWPEWWHVLFRDLTVCLCRQKNLSDSFTTEEELLSDIPYSRNFPALLRIEVQAWLSCRWFSSDWHPNK